MKKIILATLTLFFMANFAMADAVSWLNTYYRSGVFSGSSYRSPVTNGHLDLSVQVENVDITDAVFTVKYDSDLVNPLTEYSIWEIAEGMSVSSLTTENLEGSWKKTTVTMTGSLTIGSSQYLAGSLLLKLHFIPVAEGTMPVTLWPTGNFPESYHNCTLKLEKDGEEVTHGPKDFNDGTTLFAFTDKTNSKVMYHHDYNFGYPIAGYLVVTYDDDSVVEFHESDHDKGITIDPEHGAYFLTAQDGAVCHTMVFPGYEGWDCMDLTGAFSWSSSHSQPSGWLMIPELDGGGHHGGIPVTSENITLTISTPGIGTDFANSNYRMAITDYEQGVLDKVTEFAYIDDDSVSMTIQGGLGLGEYSMYVFKNDFPLGTTWFSTYINYPVVITVNDQSGNPVAGAEVVFPSCFMDCNYQRYTTDANGQVILELAGSTWGSYYDFRALKSGYDKVSDNIEVIDSGVEKTVVLSPATSLNMEDFANLAANWLEEYCLWSDDCYGADLNVDGVVNMSDFKVLTERWLLAE